MIRVNLANPESRSQYIALFGFLFGAMFFVVLIATITSRVPQKNVERQKQSTEFLRVLEKEDEKQRIYQMLAAATIDQAENKFADGKLPAPTREEIFRTYDKREKYFTKIATPTPPHLQELFEIALRNHPQAEKENFFNFKLLVINKTDRYCGLACALPTGTIIISYELLVSSKNDAETLGVLGHEITHVLNEDVRSYLALLNYFSEEQVPSADIRHAILKIILEEVPTQRQIFADHGGRKTLERSGYNPCALDDFLKRRDANIFLLERLQSRPQEFDCNGASPPPKIDAKPASSNRDIIRSVFFYLSGIYLT